MGPKYQHESLRLFDVLDKIGASEDIRQLYRELSISKEIILTLLMGSTQHGDVSSYIFGSFSEGTSTPTLKSDLDITEVIEQLPVVDNRANTPSHGESLLIISDETMQGYVKLQFVSNGIPITVVKDAPETTGVGVDPHRRLCYINAVHDRMSNYSCRRLETIIKNGPATTIERTIGRDVDIVIAHRCRNIPRIANDWIQRKRPYNWPSVTQLKSMEQFGCFFVCIGHPRSKYKHLEWRISFSLQERELMKSLNPTQHKCYIVLKLIKKDIITPKAGKSISSYHLKTVLFHSIEETGCSFWTPENLIQDIHFCILKLLNMTRIGRCPNYFIPGENMFDRLEPETLKDVDVVLTSILSSKTDFLEKLEDGIVNKLLSIKSSEQLERVVVKLYKAFPTLDRTILLALHLADFEVIVNQQYSKFKDPLTCFTQTEALKTKLYGTPTVTDHTEKEVKKALDYILPNIHLLIAKCAAASILAKTADEDDVDNLTSKLSHHVEESSCYDVMSSQLVLASYYLQRGEYNKCNNVIQICMSKINPTIHSLCCCAMYGEGGNGRAFLDLILVNSSISIKTIRTKYASGCLLFLPSHALLVHPALRFEMYRSVCIARQYRTTYPNAFLYECMVIDSIAYFHFLQYLFYTKTNKHEKQIQALGALERLVDKEEHLSHKETALNVLGWIYSEEGMVQNALNCFVKSWRTRPHYNAAKWHLVLLAFKCFMSR